ncbi:MAG: ATP-binding protein [Cyanobacteria bacterium SZAS LIN-5]|nr:ATP-binding protein [Cyanobacteria bacterium SZAS LIN-5]
MTVALSQDFEKLGLFYLGRRYDLGAEKTTDELVLYDCRDLLTHAVCIGMTGSGKTGLCLDLVEEAAIDNIPVIAIDPKGDLSNLLLTFPNLSVEEFEPWVNADEARQKNLTPGQFAEQQAMAWKTGLAEWGQSAERIKLLKSSADFKIYTPGSTAGIPISILQSLSSPPREVIEDSEAMRDRVVTTANCLLALLGGNVDPLKSREHILLSNILDRAWRKGDDLTLPEIILQIQKPPMTQVGAIDIESFFPSKDRFELAMTINNLLAAPGFDAWLSGEPLDISKLLHSESGKPQVSIFSIAHLSDTERMFFVSLLLGQMVSWMRSQSGTSSLRAILYMDEIFGYFPPVANPPSKQPLLTLLKQARAYGLGLILATQNPVDLDYKGLANTGTWFIGRLQTERDKMRVLEGLEGATAETGGKFDRQEMEKILSGLGRRVFLMNNVHESRPEIFQTRWTLSYLRGPLMKAQIKALMAGKQARLPDGSGGVDAVTNRSVAMNSPSIATNQSTGANPQSFATNQSTGANPQSVAPNQPTGLNQSAIRPALPPAVKQYFLPSKQSILSDASVVYKPFLYASATIRFTDSKTQLDETVSKAFIANVTGDGATFNWSDAQAVKYTIEKFNSEPEPGASFVEPPSALCQEVNYKNWSKSFAVWLSQSQKYQLLCCPGLQMYSLPNEQPGAFSVRVQQKLNELRDQLKEKLRTKYAPKLNALEERMRIAQQRSERQAQESRDEQLHSMISVGATIFGAMVSRRPLGSGTINKATTAARRVSRASQKQADSERALESLQSLREQFEDMQNQFDGEVNRLNQEMQSHLDSIKSTSIAPKKTNIQVNSVVLLWVPANRLA